jgi:hypothetical protein
MVTMPGPPLYEFPDPVVAAYLDQVRALPERQFATLNQLPDEPLVRLRRPATWVLIPIAVWMGLASRWRRWMTHRIAEAGCRDSDALREYRLLWAQLAHRGWHPVGESRVTLALYVLRWRRILEDAPSKYSSTIGAFIPASSIGWEHPEASA